LAARVRGEAWGYMGASPSGADPHTYHTPPGALLRCHYCEYQTPMLAVCSKCAAPALVLEGLGTEKLEETLGKAFPTARIARLDRDVVSGKDVEKVLAKVRAREVDILVGTQMVTKGHDLPHVTLVGVINADAALSIPDFRAAERAFQLLVQVAGRAGRGDAPGRVLVQTYSPETEAIVYATRHDVDGFLACELSNRRELMFPPFSRMAMARVDGPDEAEARGAAHVLQQAAARVAAQLGDGMDVKDVSTAPIARLRNRYRFRVVVRSADRAALRKVLLAMERARADLPRAVRSSIDVDPVQFL
jgi:primosomal protein N' (replication factor Y)